MGDHRLRPAYGEGLECNLPERAIPVQVPQRSLIFGKRLQFIILEPCTEGLKGFSIDTLLGVLPVNLHKHVGEILSRDFQDEAPSKGRIFAITSARKEVIGFGFFIGALFRYENTGHPDITGLKLSAGVGAAAHVEAQPLMMWNFLFQPFDQLHPDSLGFCDRQVTELNACAGDQETAGLRGIDFQSSLQRSLQSGST